MAMEYVYTYTEGTLTFNFETEVITASTSITTLEIQDLVNGCRESEASTLGMAYSKICNASGKEYLDTDNGIQVGITIVLLGNWKIHSQKISGVFKVLGGNLVQVSGGDPFIPNLLITYVNILSAASTIVQVSTGSGLSTAEHNKLFSVPSETMTSAENAQLFAIPTSGSSVSGSGLTSAESAHLFAIPTSAGMTSAEHDQLFAIPTSGGGYVSGGGLTSAEHDQLFAIPTSGGGLTSADREHLLNIADEDRTKELLYNRVNNVDANNKISNYTGGGDTNVNITYDRNGIPIREQIE